MGQKHRILLAVVLAAITATLGTIAGASTANEAVQADQCGFECELKMFCQDNVGEQTMCKRTDNSNDCSTKVCVPNES